MGCLTFVWHHFSGLQVHLAASACAHTVDLVAQFVATVLAAAEAHALIEGLLVAAAVGHSLMFLRVH